ncbi:hypothetical protein [Ideonella sp. BN130291]|uniref:hypothetical protein n=1 Tax=Ideonella sp. BN130291 TaxID=3112940 RepID=UPI002E267C99|nr:hypothetical protein [Ideonella sp. BN130291]
MMLVYVLSLRLAAVVWLLCLVWAAFLLARRLLAILRSHPAGKVGALAGPGVVLILGTAPLWVPGAYLDLKCQRARNSTFNKVEAAGEGLYWRSRPTDPNYGFGGFYLQRGNAIHNSFASAAVRAMAEGRLGYLVMPFTVDADQKLFVAPVSSPHTCLSGEVRNAWGHLPPHLCIAWERAPNFPARYEVTGLLNERFASDEVSIRDRTLAVDIARVSYVANTHASETLLVLFGARSYQPVSCTSDLTDGSTLASLPLLTFTVPDDPLARGTSLSTYLALPWRIKPF